jgi:hypothetical protein
MQPKLVIQYQFSGDVHACLNSLFTLRDEISQAGGRSERYLVGGGGVNKFFQKGLPNKTSQIFFQTPVWGNGGLKIPFQTFLDLNFWDPIIRDYLVCGQSLPVLYVTYVILCNCLVVFMFVCVANLVK